MHRACRELVKESVVLPDEIQLFWRRPATSTYLNRACLHSADVYVYKGRTKWIVLSDENAVDLNHELHIPYFPLHKSSRQHGFLLCPFCCCHHSRRLC